jgi:hypothetical protein
VLVVGIVDRYNSTTGLLYFRQMNSSLSFGVNPYVLAIDAGNTSSFVDGSITTTNLVSGTSGGTLINGTSYSSANSGSWVFDGVNDYIDTSFTGTFTSNATIVMWLQLDNLNGGLMGFDYGLGASRYTFSNGLAYINVFRANRVDTITLGPTVRTNPHMVTITTDGTNWKLYQNSSLITSVASEAPIRLLAPYIGRSSQSDINLQGKIFQFNLLNQALSATQITNYYNNTKSRFGL